VKCSKLKKLTFLANYNNNNNTNANVYCVVIIALPLREFTQFMW